MPLPTFCSLLSRSGAQTQIYCATSPAAKGGHYYQDLLIKKALADAYDKEAATRLWDESIKWIVTLSISDLETA